MSTKLFDAIRSRVEKPVTSIEIRDHGETVRVTYRRHSFWEDFDVPAITGISEATVQRNAANMKGILMYEFPEARVTRT